LALQELPVSEAIALVDRLLEEGRPFTFSNFARFDSEGYAGSRTPEWTAWTTRVASVVRQHLTESSAAAALLKKAEADYFIYFKPTDFPPLLANYLGALELAREALNEDSFGELRQRETAIAPQDLTNKVFIVHGHDEAAKNELEILLRDMGLDPVVLHRQADQGKTIIEKFEAHADVGYAFVLLTPDEVAYLADDEDKADDQRIKEKRARPNVIWEFGYFVGHLGRHRTCCLYRGGVALPSDLDGLIYKPFAKSVEEVAWGIQKELRAAGYKLAPG
jgi:predicted nucleotide-binding protein